MFPGSKDLTGIRRYELPDGPFINKYTVIQFSNELLDFLSSDSDNKLNFSNIHVNQFMHLPAQFQNRIFILSGMTSALYIVLIVGLKKKKLALSNNFPNIGLMK